jgi:type I restriction enzyme M protein
MPQTNHSAANLGFETELWRAADALRSNMDAAEYKHVVLGLIFLKYISDAFEEIHARLTAEIALGADPEDPDEYRAVNTFWVPKEARWSHLQNNARQPTIGKLVDEAMLAIERDNPTLKGVLPKDYAHPRLDKQRLGQLIDLIADIGLGDAANRSRDILGRVYEYFLSQFASAEGKKGGQFYTPRCVVGILVAMLAPYRGRVYDPCCGSGGMFVQSERFVEAHGGRIGDISIYGQESNHTTWRLAKMNLAIRGIEGNLGAEHADSFHRDLHPDLKADYVLANPPFNDSDWRGDLLKDDRRWQYGAPPSSNANYAWVQHFIYHLAPTGMAGFVLANGSMSSNQSGEGDIRAAIIEADLVDCMVALPGQLFYSTQIPVCLWFIARDKTGGHITGGHITGGHITGGHIGPPLRDRRGETLFIDARQMGTMIDRTHRELTEDDIAKIAGTYHAWRGGPVGADLRVRPVRPEEGQTYNPEQGQTYNPEQGQTHNPEQGQTHNPEQGQTHRSAPTTHATGYVDVPGFCKSATLDDIRAHNHILTPGRYVGAAEVEDDGEPFEEKMERLVNDLRAQMEQAAQLDQAIWANLEAIGYGE